jgi:flagellar protein FliS
MLYDGAVRFVGEAIDADAKREIARRGQAIKQTIAHLRELQSTLNVDSGGQLAVDLDKLYGYIQQRLLDVTMKKDTGALPEVQKLLTTLRDGWSQIASQPTAAGARSGDGAAAPDRRAVDRAA